VKRLNLRLLFSRGLAGKTLEQQTFTGLKLTNSVRVDHLVSRFPHGAFFVVGKRNWYRNTPLRVAIGIIVGEKTSFVWGSVEAVERRKRKALRDSGSRGHCGKRVTQADPQIPNAKANKGTARKSRQNLAPEQVREFVPYTKGDYKSKSYLNNKPDLKFLLKQIEKMFIVDAGKVLLKTPCNYRFEEVLELLLDFFGLL